LDEYKALYLSPQHIGHPGYGCPMPALGSELAREAEPVQAEFALGLERVIAAFTAAVSGPAEARRAAALREISMLVGAVVLARASGERLAAEVLQACRD
jgi:TetR/AcrR family transcriptional repressor of nem operon